MKVIGAYAIAAGLSTDQILASSLLMGAILLIIGLTGAIDVIRKVTPQAVIQGVQLSTGALLIAGGTRFVMGTSRFQLLQEAAEPFLTFRWLGPVPIGVVIGGLAGLATLLLLDNKRFPAGLVVVAGGLVSGLILGARMTWVGEGFSLGLPTILGSGFPARGDWTFALFALVLPQLPMTLGNAVLAYTDLSEKYFVDRALKVTNRMACVSMAFANFLSFFLGGIPICHGAGGLAAHYRFGSRTAGSNLWIGLILIVLALLLGENIIGFLQIMPMSVLGVLLVFAGAQLALTILDLNSRGDLFVAVLILGVTLASNLAVGFVVGMLVAHLLKWRKLRV
jgi:SulP family sulfate permease